MSQPEPDATSPAATNPSEWIAAGLSALRKAAAALDEEPGIRNQVAEAQMALHWLAGFLASPLVIPPEVSVVPPPGPKQEHPNVPERYLVLPGGDIEFQYYDQGWLTSETPSGYIVRGCARYLETARP